MAMMDSDSLQACSDEWGEYIFSLYVGLFIDRYLGCLVLEKGAIDNKSPEMKLVFKR